MRKESNKNYWQTYSFPNTVFEKFSYLFKGNLPA